MRNPISIPCIVLSACLVAGAAAGGPAVAIGSANGNPTEFSVIARSVRPGEWRLIPKPASAAFYKQGQISETTWGVVGPKQLVMAWNGAAYDPTRREMHLHGGGHADYGGNEVLTFSFDTLSWRRPIETYDLPRITPERPCPQPERDKDGPPSGHTYDGLVWSRVLDAMIYFQTHGFCLRGDYARDRAFRSSVWLADTRKGEWRRLGPASVEAYAATVELPDGRIVVLGHQGAPRVYDPHAGKYVRTGERLDWEFPHAIYAPDRDAIYVTDWTRIFRLDPKTLQAVEIAKRATLGAETNYSDGFAYHPPTRRLVLWNGNRRIVLLDPDTKQARLVESGQTGPRGQRPWSKFIHLPEFDVFVGVSSSDDGVWVYRLPAG